jgi:hypothetical protein
LDNLANSLDIRGGNLNTAGTATRKCKEALPIEVHTPGYALQRQLRGIAICRLIEEAAL